ncbi:MAG: TldD/PmbA family protein [Nitrospirota bacterium]
MISYEVIQKILKRALRQGGDYAEIFVEHTRPTGIILEDNKIEKVISGIDIGAGIRIIFNGKTAYAYTNELSERALIELAETASNVVKQTEKDTTINLIRRNPSVDFTIKRHPQSVGISEKVSVVSKANTLSRKYDNRIRQVTVSYRDVIQKVQIGNSEGLMAEDERIHTLFFINVIASDGDIIQTGYEPVGGLIGFEIFNEHPPEVVAEKASKRAVMMLSAKRAHGGKMPVVISAEAGGTMIHEAIGHGLEADLAQQGLSVFSGKIGKQVASKIITVVDDATLPNKRGSFRFDDEGVEAQRTVLVENGILKGYMYDRLSAMKDGVRPTGNGRRESYKHKPIPRMTNTFIALGTSNPVDIIKSIDKGLFVKKMGGGQVNTVNGDFVFEVNESYLIEYGQIGEPVRGATLTGNGPEILNQIDMVGNDLGFSIGTCGKDGQGVPVSDAMPTIRIPRMVVGGEV